MKRYYPRENRERMLEANRLYRTGLTYSETGRGLSPPVSAVRVGQLLVRGAKLGLFAHPRRERESGAALTVAEVRKTAQLCASRGQVAGRLRTDRKRLEERFGAVIDDVFAARRAARKSATRARIVADVENFRMKLGRTPSWYDLSVNLRARVKKQFGNFDALRAFAEGAENTPAANRLSKIRERTIDDYRAASSSLGRNPTSADIGARTGLFRRIFKYFGTFEAFLEAARVRPDYVKRTWRDREVARLERRISG